jgi:hypothetical protein
VVWRCEVGLETELQSRLRGMRLSNHLSRHMQARVKAVADIVNKLVEGVTSGKDVNLNEIKRDAALRYKVHMAVPWLLLLGFSLSVPCQCDLNRA